MYYFYCCFITRVSISGTLTSPEKKLPLEKLILQSERRRALNWSDGNIKCQRFKAAADGSFEYLKHSSVLIMVQNQTTATEKCLQVKNYHKVPRHSLVLKYLSDLRADNRKPKASCLEDTELLEFNGMRSLA